MTDYLTQMGYRKYDISPNMRDLHCMADVLFQKVEEDDLGIKYHIELYYYEPRCRLDAAWMAEIVISNPFVSFQQHDLTINSGSDLLRIEKRCHDFWKMMGSPYHELYEVHDG